VCDEHVDNASLLLQGSALVSVVKDFVSMPIGQHTQRHAYLFFCSTTDLYIELLSRSPFDAEAEQLASFAAWNAHLAPLLSLCQNAVVDEKEVALDKHNFRKINTLLDKLQRRGVFKHFGGEARKLEIAAPFLEIIERKSSTGGSSSSSSSSNKKKSKKEAISASSTPASVTPAPIEQQEQQQQQQQAEIDSGNKQTITILDYSYFKAFYCLKELVKEARLNYSLETTAFELLHRLARVNEVLEQDHIASVAMAALLCATKLHSEEYRAVRLDTFIRAYLDRLHVHEPLKMDISAQSPDVTEIVRKRVLEHEVLPSPIV